MFGTHYRFNSVESALAACNLAVAYGYQATSSRHGSEADEMIKAADEFIDKLVNIQGGARGCTVQHLLN